MGDDKHRHLTFSRGIIDMDGSLELEALDSTVNSPSVDFKKKKRRILILLLAYSAILGVMTVFLPDENRFLDFIVSLPFLILGVAWCFMDAAERDYRIGRLLSLVLILIFFIGFPVYLVQTRRFGAFKTLGLALLLVVAIVAVAIVTELVTLCIGDVAGLWDFDYGL